MIVKYLDNVDTTTKTMFCTGVEFKPDKGICYLINSREGKSVRVCIDRLLEIYKFDDRDNAKDIDNKVAYTSICHQCAPMSGEDNTQQVKISEVCATCKHFRLLKFNEFRNGLDSCTRNAFDEHGRRICKWEGAG